MRSSRCSIRDRSTFPKKSGWVYAGEAAFLLLRCGVFVLLLYFAIRYALSVYSGGAALDIKAPVILSVLIIVSVVDLLWSLRNHLLTFDDSGVRSLSLLKGPIVTPWDRVRYVDLGGLRCRFEVLHSDSELGEMDFNRIERPEDAFKLISSKLDFESNERARSVRCRIERELGQDPPSSFAQLLARLLELAHGVCAGVLLAFAMRPAEDMSTTDRYLFLGGSVVVLVLWSLVANQLKKKWPKVRLTIF